MPRKAVSKPKLKNVKFLFTDECAKFVSLVGEFNGWQAGRNLMEKDRTGKFSASLKLEPGIYSYKFLADTGWKIDSNKPTVRDELGNENNQVSVE